MRGMRLLPQHVASPSWQSHQKAPSITETLPASTDATSKRTCPTPPPHSASHAAPRRRSLACLAWPTARAGTPNRSLVRVFTSTMVARGKPAPDLFLYAAARMGADPARTLVIEDSLTGIRAGLAAGMTVWRFVGGSHLGPKTPEEPEDARPHRRLVSFADFFQIAPSLGRQPA